MTAIQPCTVCDSFNFFGTFSMHINDKLVVVCGKCSEKIREVSEDNVYDHQYDEFLGALMGRRSIVINTKSGAKFNLSHRAQIAYADRTGLTYDLRDREDRYATATKGRYVVVAGDPYWYTKIDRDDKILVDIVRELKDEASDSNCTLSIVSIPTDVSWRIESLNGEEWIVEKHRVWY